MYRNLVFYIFGVILAAQSIAAVIDAHRMHQAQQAHQPGEHSHLHQTVHTGDEPEVVNDSEIFWTNGYDCHHCCHCHGLSHLYIETQTAAHDLLESLKARAVYPYFYASVTSAPDNPPPIA